MKRLTVKGDNWGSKVIEEALRMLRGGNIIMYPTETCYGLGVDIFNEEALQKLYTLKKMKPFKPVSIVVISIEDAKKWGEIDEKAFMLLERYWPGPYTFVVNRSGTLPHFFNKGISKVGLRNPLVSGLIEIVEKFGRPITTTSANISGKPQCYEVDEFLGQLKGENIPVEPDLIIDGGQIGENPPSTVYDCVDDVVIRGEIEV